MEIEAAAIEWFGTCGYGKSVIVTDSRNMLSKETYCRLSGDTV
jgi:hypothetical protein